MHVPDNFREVSAMQKQASGPDGEGLGEGSKLHGQERVLSSANDGRVTQKDPRN